MSLIDIGIVGIDVVFAAALLLAVSCLAYLAYLTIREHAVLKSIARGPVRIVGWQTSIAADVRAPARSRTVKSLRPSAVHQRVTSH